MAAKKKSAPKKAAKKPAARAKAKPKSSRAPRAKLGASGDVVYSDVLHQLRSTLVSRLVR